MRNLRAEWIELVKSSSDLDVIDDQGKKKQLSKRKKLIGPWILLFFVVVVNLIKFIKK